MAAVELLERVMVKVKCPAFSYTDAGFGEIEKVVAGLDVARVNATAIPKTIEQPLPIGLIFIICLLIRFVRFNHFLPVRKKPGSMARSFHRGFPRFLAQDVRDKAAFSNGRLQRLN